ncbi:MAG: CoA transferase [Caulobacteraceae bacterium]|nr:CoA transferase [Caulobacteraceae bacterium]
MIELLKGIRVVECAVLFNGDQTGRLLGDMGADVIKVEAPGVGDYLRDFLGQITPHHSPAHMYVNRNKRSVTMNLRSEEGREAFFELLKTADIFVDGFAGDACAKLGIGYEDQIKVKPDIIYAQCSGFGAKGPYAQIPTHGMMMGALAGAPPLQMCEDGFVRPSGDALGDGSVVGPSYTALAAVAALQHRARTGKGAYIDGAGSDSVLATNWMPATYTWNDARLTDRRSLPARQTNRESASAKYQYYETKDKRFVLFCGIEHKFWDNFCRAVGREDLVESKDTHAPVDFGGNETELRRELQKIFHTKTQSEWADIALKYDIAMGPAHRLEDLRTDPHLAGREIIYEGVHPDAGPFVYVGWPAPVAGQPFEVSQPAPRLGQHNREVLGELGYSAAQIDALAAAKAI